MSGGPSSRAIREGLGHPVIDVDGHLQELSTFFRDDVLDYAREVGGPKLVERIDKTALMFDEDHVARWFAMTEDERRDVWSPCMAWWAMPTDARP